MSYRKRSWKDFSANEATQSEIVEIVEGLSDSDAGIVNINASVIKKVINEIKHPLEHIFNCSLRYGIFPDKLKISKIVPLFKQGCKQNLNNYRPISILPTFSKILEKIIYNRLNIFLEFNEVLTESQFGFRTHRSTTSAVLSVTDHILKSFDEQKLTLGVFLDLSKAFDCVNHNILLRKLEHYGVRGVALNLFESYLTGRQQFSFFKNEISRSNLVTHSVPQGSILGPVLFNIYINDITNATKTMKTTLFADDSCFYLSHNNPETLINIANNDLNSLNNWFVSNRLTLNIKKSHCIIFKRQINIPPDLPKVKINNVNIDMVDDTKFLGIIIQSNLKWTLHIQSIKNKLNKYSSIIYLTRKSLDNSSLKLIYNSLVYSCLNYGNILWGRSPKSHTNCLRVAQKRVIRNIKFRSRFHHTNDDFYNLGILKLNDINFYFGAIFTYKSLNNLTYSLNYFSFVNNNTNYPLRNAQELRPPFPGSTQTKSSPAYYCCIIWNSLPPSIKLKPSVGSFKFSLKNYLVNKYLEVS